MVNLEYYLNILTGELCDPKRMSLSDFVTKAGGWMDVVAISKEAYEVLLAGDSGY